MEERWRRVLRGIRRMPAWFPKEHSWKSIVPREADLFADLSVGGGDPKKYFSQSEVLSPSIAMGRLLGGWTPGRSAGRK